MDWPQAVKEGFALAALAHDDRSAALAARGLSPSIAASTTEPTKRLWLGDRGARRAFVRRMLASRPCPDSAPADVPPRALGLLAAEVNRDLGRSWLAQAPLPRAGFIPDRHLLPHLRTHLLTRMDR